MQNATEVKDVSTAAQSCPAGARGGSFNRRTLYIALGLAAAAGLVLGWNWLVAVGAASLIVAVAPCLVMCALGLCMSRACGDKKTQAPVKADTGNVEAAVTTTAAEDLAATGATGEAAPKAARPDTVDATVAQAPAAPKARTEPASEAPV
jgi:hypothetical protein